MLKFEKVNVNPKGRKTGDCSTRAITSCLGIDYKQVLKEQYEIACKYCYDFTSKQTTEKILAKYGWVKMKQPRKIDGKKYLVGELDQLCTKAQLKNGVLVLMAHHWSCAKDDSIVDLWDCRRKTIGNYWVKG